MQEHTTGVVDLAARFADDFGAAEIAGLAGWLHDIGKYSDEFQKYLLDCDAKRPAKKIDHKTAGTKLASSFKGAIGEVLTRVVLGHHGGLPARPDIKTKIKEVERLQDLDAVIARAKAELPQLSNSPVITDQSIVGLFGTQYEEKDDILRFEMLIRFVFSCLVDADSIDTEAHFEKNLAANRSDGDIGPYLDGWINALTASQAELPIDKTAPKVVAVRRQVYEACLDAAELKPGLFTLTVPTGGGKTRSSLAFALKHAKKNRMRRLIYSIPFTSIIDQTAAVFRGILGDDAVLEHHSAIDPRLTKEDVSDEEEVRRRLATDNWSAPLIVTTNVQFFESLFARATSKCRKLHNIARSVIVLDEIQTLPLHLLVPLVDGLRSLIYQFGCTVVLCTATQPAIAEDTPITKGIGEPVKIIQDPAPHFDALKRVTYRVEEQPLAWADVATKMRERSTSCITVVNTKKDAIALTNELGESRDDVFHLSTLLCGAHRRSRISEIKQRLLDEREGKRGPIYVATTQLIEAGVDLDSPRVMRARGPLDRVIQAAGRCNREGRNAASESEVLIFDPVDGRSPLGEYRTALEEADRMIKESDNQLDFDSPEVATRYFERLYETLQAGYLDKAKVQDSRRLLDFPAVAEKVRLIKEDTIPVLVLYKPEEKLYYSVRREVEWRVRDKKPLTRKLWRNMQPITVAVYTTDVANNPGNFDVLVPDQLLSWRLPYDEVFGIGGSEVYRDPSDLFV